MTEMFFGSSVGESMRTAGIFPGSNYVNDVFL